MVPGLHTSQGELKKFIAWNTHKKAIVRHHVSPKQIFQPPGPSSEMNHPTTKEQMEGSVQLWKGVEAVKKILGKQH